jgi:hypothetical protein
MQCLTATGSGRRQPALGVAALALATLLAACHGVVSDKPLLTRAADAPTLRQGIWRGSSILSTPCDVDVRQPIAAWPDCAGAIIVGKSKLVELTRDHGRLKRTNVPYVLAAGQPLIVQLADSPGKNAQYEYLWVRVTSLDDEGRITGVAGWRVFCNSHAANAPLYPGLTDRDGDCTADSVGALRGAAKASSESDADSPAQLRWVRDGTK